MPTLHNQLISACRRRNHVMAAYVNAAASVQTRLGLSKVERFALEAGVPARVVLRVLMAHGPHRPHGGLYARAGLAGLGEDASAASAAYFRMPMAAAQAWGVNRRVDERTAMLVDAAVNAAASHGIAGAAAELVALGFPVEFVFRVLCNPRLRRRYLAVPPERNRPMLGPAGVCRRRNRMQAAYVNAALTISKLISVQRAEAILVEQGVPHKVIVRALYLNGMLRSSGGACYAGDSM